MYGNVEIKYSKFGIEDFDFGYYNYTKYSGLETHIVNSYANALLQLYRFTPVVRNLALHHTARDCGYKNCMLCELGFLIDMLEKAKGKSCQASNFLKTLSKLSSASALAVLEEHTVNTPLSVMIQNLNRFLLSTMEENNRLISSDPQQMQFAFGTTGYALSQCGHCNYEASQPKISSTTVLLVVVALSLMPGTFPQERRSTSSSLGQAEPASQPLPICSSDSMIHRKEASSSVATI